MEFSYWERKTWFSEIDFTIVGSGIVGLSCALELRKKHPKAKIVILEKGMLPQGASTKNAGFACFGSVSEILDDLSTSSEEEVLQLIQQRVEGMVSLRKLIGNENLDYQSLGGYELFTKEQKLSYEECKNELERINKLLYPIFNQNVYQVRGNPFGFGNIQSDLIFNAFDKNIKIYINKIILTYL